LFGEIPGEKVFILGSGHKVSATPGRRILGWGMNFFSGIWMGYEINLSL
jgi:hypothetical protein